MPISIDDWLGMSSKRRTRMLCADEDDEDDVEQLLSAIHPSLRVAEPRQVSNWEDLQFAHERRGKFTTQSNSSRTSLHGDVAEQLTAARQDMSTGLYQINTKLEGLATQERLMREIDQVKERERERDRETREMQIRMEREKQELQAQMQRERQEMQSKIQQIEHETEEELKQLKYEKEALRIQLYPNSDLLHISGSDQSAQPTIEHSYSIQQPAYEVFTTIDTHEHTLRRFFIQPHYAAYGAEVNDYGPAVRHFIDKQQSPLAGVLSTGASMSVTFHCLIAGQARNFSFREYPQSHKTLVEYIETVYAEEGSDLFKQLRNNITGVSVNVVSAYVGGCLDPSGTCSPGSDSITKNLWLTVRDYKNRAYDDSCFYACIRYIQKELDGVSTRQHYKTMRTKLTGSPFDKPVPIDLLAKAEEVFGLKLIVLGPDTPTTLFRAGGKEQKTFRELRGSVLTTYHTYFYNGVDHELSESSDSPLELVKNGALLAIKTCGETYHLLSLNNGHYSNVVGITRPSLCLKCGSEKHSERDLHRDVVRLECLERLKHRLTPQAISDVKPSMKYVVFDFETVVIEGMLTPYAVAWTVDDDEPCFRIGQSCLEMFMTAMHKIEGVKLLIGYNSSRFDNFFTLRHLIQAGTKLSSSNCTIHSNQILSLRSRGFRVWDICQYTKCSLQQACEAFSISVDMSPRHGGGHAALSGPSQPLTGKSQYDHKFVQSQFDVYGWDFISHVGEKEIKDYNIRDVLLTRTLFKLVKSALYDITAIDPLQTMTLAQLAYRHMQAFNRELKIDIQQVPIRYDEVFDSVPAGRVQMFVESGEYGGEQVQVDANGLYQYVCLNWDMPAGEMQEYSSMDDVPTEILEHGLCLVQCDVDQTSLRVGSAHSPMGIKLVGQKSPTERIDWCRDKVQNAWLWGEEIALLEQKDCFVLKGRVLAWSKRCRPFEVMNIYREIRQREKAEGRGGGVKDNMAKLMSNAPTGKCYQRNREDEWAIVSSLTESEAFRSKHSRVTFDTTDVPHQFFIEGDKIQRKEMITKPRHIGARIYAMARLYMFQHISSLSSIKYMDTDGFIMAKWEYLQHPELHDAPELGKFKVEAEGDHVYLVSLKNYAICNHSTGKPTCILPVHSSKTELNKCAMRNHHHKYRIKGYHDGDVWTAQDGRQGKFINEDLYRALLAGEVTTTVERIRKQFVRASSGRFQLSTLTMRVEERLLV